LEELGVELDRAARRTLAVPRTRLSASHRLSVVATIVVLLVLAAVAAAAVLITSGSPLPAPHAQDLQSGGIPLPSSVHLAGLDVPDPQAGAPPWDIRLSRTSAGETCTAVGQVLNGQFGIVGLDHVFRALPLGGVDACGFQSATGPVLAGARVFSGSSSMEARTVVNGVAGAGARSVTAYGPEGARALRLGPDGSFITVYRGYLDEVPPTGFAIPLRSRSLRRLKWQIRTGVRRGRSAEKRTSTPGPIPMRTARRSPACTTAWTRVSQTRRPRRRSAGDSASTRCSC
jgi:hypothetical protein